MKKSLNKVIVTLAAVAALAMGTTAMAADVTGNETVTDSKSTLTYTVDGKGAGEQVTVLVLVDGAMDDEEIKADEIKYIDQVAAGEDGKAEFNIPLADVAEGDKFTLMSGSETADAPIENKVTLGVKANYGDLTGEGLINTTDAQMTLQAAVGKVTLTDDQKVAADVDGNSLVNTSDAQAILYKAVGKTPADPTAAENMAWAK